MGSRNTRANLTPKGKSRKAVSYRQLDRRFVVLFGLASVIVMVVVATMAIRSLARSTPATPVAAMVVAGEARVPVSGLREGMASFYTCATPSAQPLRFLVVEVAPGDYRAALDANETGDGGFHQHGETLSCTGCGLRFQASDIGERAGGCYPIAVARRVEAGDLVIRVDDLLEAGTTAGKRPRPGM